MTDDEKYLDALDHFLKSDEDTLKQKKLRKKVLLTFFMCLVADLISSFDFYAMTHDWIITQIFTGLIAQAIWFTTGFFFYDSKDKRERIALFIGTALGCSLGSTLMLTWFKPLFNTMF